MTSWRDSPKWCIKKVAFVFVLTFKLSCSPEEILGTTWTFLLRRPLDKVKPVWPLTSCSLSVVISTCREWVDQLWPLSVYYFTYSQHLYIQTISTHSQFSKSFMFSLDCLQMCAGLISSWSQTVKSGRQTENQNQSRESGLFSTLFLQTESKRQ